jgi:two-component system, chemotaxis family, CheB/CheR fusion protein
MKFKRSHQPAAPAGAVCRRRSPAAGRDPRGFSIVGVGASAGGLEAFTDLLRQLPVDTGFGFVLVQHLDPQHESALAQLLARATAMPVLEVTDRLRVRPDHVYIIPPNTDLGIVHGVLKLQLRPPDRSAPRAIDSFFAALARDQGRRAVGVILSGTATDGTRGLEAIKAAGGLTFAQDGSARYDSMPRSATAAGCVDFVLSPGAIAQELARIAGRPAPAGRTTDTRPATAIATGSEAPGDAASAGAAGLVAAAPAADESQAGHPQPDGYRKILRLLRDRCGLDFSLYKSPTIRRRIGRRMVLGHQETLAAYADFLRDHPKELDALYSDALISVTGFFRNPDAFAALKRRVFPRLLGEPGDEPVRAWVLGCSTGQEAYSVAMAFAESGERLPHGRRLQIFATDINEANLEKARSGLYAKNLVRDLSPERLRRFFVEEEAGYRAIKPLREQVVFARQNLIGDPPFSRMDFICCRNLMIYLEPGLQQKVLPMLHYALKPEGFLFLGASESIGSFAELFEPVDKKHKIFSRKSAPTSVFQLPVGAVRAAGAAPARSPRTAPRAAPSYGWTPDSFRGELNAEREADRVTVNHFAPPGVLIDAGLQILQFRGATGAYLEPPAGKASFNLLKMARGGLMLPLRAAIQRAQAGNRIVRQEGISLKQDGQTRRVNVEVVPLKNLKERCFLVLFEDAPTGARRPDPAPAAGRKEESGRVARLERELAETRDYLQSVQEHQEAANEELQASNEEGESANEELQSLNEELETSKEELESTNEELTTVNEEMVGRNAELNRLNSDLTNLQTSTQLAIVLLGRDLTVHRFSPQAGRQFNLATTDIGRPIAGLRHRLRLTGLDTIIAQVVASGHEAEREVRDEDDRWYSLRVRPYVTADRAVDGAVLVLVDIDDLKKTERLVLEEHEHAEAVIRTVPDPLVILTAGLRLQSANDAFYRAFQISPAETNGRLIYDIGGGSWNIPRLRHLLEDVVPQNSFFNDFEVTHTFAKIGRRSLLLNARMLNAADGKPKEILLGIHDITERQQAEEALRAARTELARHASQLETLVAERTVELTATNHRLEGSVASIQKGREEYRALLQESQLMQRKLRLLTRQILTAQEEERKKISRELHDEVVQTLVGINVELSALGRGHTIGGRSLKSKIAHTQRLVENSVNAVHRFARELRPAVLDDLGLIPALHTYSKSLAARHKLKIQITAFGGVETLGSAERTMLFRIAQEALTNVVRHSGAREVKVTISRIPHAIRMEIGDNGRAFVVKRTLLAKNNKRLGLIGMKERAEMVGGSLTIESAPGRGTTVRVEVPFGPPKTQP